MKEEQKFCCECGAPMINNICANPSSSNSDNISHTSKNEPSNSFKGVKIIAKVAVTLIIMGIVAGVATTIGGIPTYITGGICFVILPNMWKFIDGW